jgi:hypothetical protein
MQNEGLSEKNRALVEQTEPPVVWGWAAAHAPVLNRLLDAARADCRPSAGEGLSEREAIARIIDPVAFSVAAKVVHAGLAEMDRDDALAKADAILALRPSIAGEGEALAFKSPYRSDLTIPVADVLTALERWAQHPLTAPLGGFSYGELETGVRMAREAIAARDVDGLTAALDGAQFRTLSHGDPDPARRVASVSIEFLGDGGIERVHALYDILVAIAGAPAK